jgi:hypothetical protein
MVTTRCLICQNPSLRSYVDGGLNKGVSNAGIAAGLAAAGGTLDPDVIGRHKNNHWTKPEEPGAPKPTKRDLAIMLRDQVIERIEAGDVDILDKEVAPGLGVGLKAQALLDKREQTERKLGLAAGYLGLQLFLQGLGDERPEPVMIEDGLTVEGEFSEAV